MPGQPTRPEPSELVREALEQGDDSGDLRSLGGIEAVREYPPHVLVYRRVVERGGDRPDALRS